MPADAFRVSLGMVAVPPCRQSDSPATYRSLDKGRIRPVSAIEAISGLKCGLALAQIGPALIGMVERDRLPEDLLEIIDGELQVALGDGHVGMPECLLHEVDVARPKILLQYGKSFWLDPRERVFSPAQL